VVTGCDSLDCHINALGLGAYEYLNKPLYTQDLDRITRIAETGTGHSS
jgi:ActR/RegA family two-component response regulator